MEVRLVVHASIVVRTEDARILCDPWFHGRAFNQSWALLSEPVLSPTFYDDITHLWISHEHPDHLHFPTLASLPEAFRKRVHVLFQENNSTKVFSALKNLGFQHFTPLPHRRWVSLEGCTEVMNHQFGSMDSSLTVRDGEATLLDLNDCEISEEDGRRLRRDVGPPDVLLNQFSIAGYSGMEDRDHYLKASATSKLAALLRNHQVLGAATTIPFASHIYFCMEDNRYVNAYGNTYDAVLAAFQEAGASCTILAPGQSYVVGSRHNTGPALEYYHRLNEGVSKKTYYTSEMIPLDEVRAHFQECAAKLRGAYPGWILSLLRPVKTLVPDWDQIVEFHIASGRLEPTDGPADVTTLSQPLDHVFRFPWGMQTLGVSARLTLHRNVPNWLRHRVLFSLYNAEVYLRARSLLDPKTVRWIYRRLPGAWSQIRHKLHRLRPS
jgi:UDP-MurNAc hydroxylase